LKYFLVIVIIKGVNMSDFNNRFMPTYEPEAVQYMRDELTDVGFEEVVTVDEVDFALNQQDDQVVLLVINSVCGCAAGGARPGVALALHNDLIPDRLVTAFAGQDKQAIEYIRQRYLSDFVPSSPSIVLFKNSEMINILERKDLVNLEPERIADILSEFFNKTCRKPGPSINRELYDSLGFTIMCSSNIPKFNGI
jgi:putative YphP/YqiW family bacilliredoxin